MRYAVGLVSGHMAGNLKMEDTKMIVTVLSHSDMALRDILLREEYLQWHLRQYKQVYLNWVAGLPFEANLQKGQAEMALRNGAPQVDFIGVPVSGDTWDVILFWDDPRLEAVEILQKFVAMWPHEDKPEIRLILYTHYLRLDVEAAAKEAGIIVIDDSCQEF